MLTSKNCLSQQCKLTRRSVTACCTDGPPNWQTKIKCKIIEFTQQKQINWKQNIVVLNKLVPICFEKPITSGFKIKNSGSYEETHRALMKKLSHFMFATYLHCKLLKSTHIYYIYASYHGYKYHISNVQNGYMFICINEIVNFKPLHDISTQVR